MEGYSTEEEQIRALKQWWDENGSSTLIGLGLAMAIVFGWQWWQERSTTRAQEAAILYQQLTQATELAADDPVQHITAEHLAGEIMSEQAGSRHGDYAALVLARMDVEKGELASAESQLRELMARQPDQPVGMLQQRFKRLTGGYLDPRVGALARLRLARVVFAQARGDEALKLLDDAGTADFAFEKAELRGDILRAQGDTGAARAAYTQAVELSEGQPGRLLEMKLQELDANNAPVVADEVPATAAPVTPPVMPTPTEDKP